MSTSELTLNISISDSESCCSYTYSIEDAITSEKKTQQRRSSRDSEQSGGSYCSYQYSPKSGDNNYRHINDNACNSSSFRRYISSKGAETKRKWRSCEQKNEKTNTMYSGEQEESDRRNINGSTGTRREWQFIDYSYHNDNLDRWYSAGSASNCIISDCTISERTEDQFEKTPVFDAIGGAECLEESEGTFFDPIRRLFLEGFRRVPLRRRILHDVYEKVHNDPGCRLDRRILHQKYTRAIWMLAEHAITSISSMTAPTLIDPVDAKSSVNCVNSIAPITTDLSATINMDSNILDGDTLVELFPPNSSVCNTGLISQTICRRMEEGYIYYTSPGETRHQVIKLDIYNFNNICNIEKDQWWKHAEMRSTFLVSSNVDKKFILLQSLLKTLAKDFKAIPKVKKEVKGTGLWRFSGHTRRHQ